MFLSSNRTWATACVVATFVAVVAIGCQGPDHPAAPEANRPADTSASADYAEMDAGAEATSMPAGGAMLPMEAAPGEGSGPGMSGDKHDVLVENEFLRTLDEPLSTFSIDVDTASYSKVRQHLLEYKQLPPADAVRIEELVNYFPYDYDGPADAHPFAVHCEATACPWQPEHRLLRIGLQARRVDLAGRPPLNLVFLLDTSGSMHGPNRLGLVKQALQMLVDQLGPRDRVAIVTYAGSAGLVLPSTAGDRKPEIVAAFNRLEAGGSTAGGAGIELAYQVARDYFVEGGENRVILCTDGDFNVGVTSTGGLVALAEKQAQQGVFLSVFGFGIGNTNDAMLEQISNKANGNYGFIDNAAEARKVMVEQANATLVTVAKDVKIQVEFNPAHVAAYRLIGYENRLLAARDFNDDTKDAGEIGAGHTVTALYELVPPEAADLEQVIGVDPLKYQKQPELSQAAEFEELATVKLRYKQPDADASTLIEQPISDIVADFAQATESTQFASSVALFGMLLRKSKHAGDVGYPLVQELGGAAVGEDPHGYRVEFLKLVEQAERLSGAGNP